MKRLAPLVVSMNLLDQPIKSSFGQRASPVHVSDTIVDELGSGKLRQAKPYADTVSVVGGRLVGLLINFFLLEARASLMARASLLFYNLLRLEPLSWLEPRYYFWS